MRGSKAGAGTVAVGKMTAGMGREREHQLRERVEVQQVFAPERSLYSS